MLETKETKEIKKIDNPSNEQFREETNDFSSPVVITGIVSKWQAFGMFNLDTIKYKFGNARVTVRESDDEYEYFFGNGRKREINLAEYIEMISPPFKPDKRPPYLGNLPFDHPNVVKYLSPIKSFFNFPKFIPAQQYGELRLWIGGGGQRSTIHNDNYHNLNAQIDGKKDFLLFAPQEAENLYVKELTKACWVSPIDIDNYNKSKYSRFADTTAYHTTLSAGEMLYIPIFWWHQVTAKQTSISVSMFIHTDETKYWLS